MNINKVFLILFGVRPKSEQFDRSELKGVRKHGTLTGWVAESR